MNLSIDKKIKNNVDNLPFINGSSFTNVRIMRLISFVQFSF